MDASVNFLLENLRDVVVYHAKLISGAEKELKELEKELELMKKKLEDAAKKQKKEKAFKEWEKQIRRVVYQVEDVIDACVTNMACKGAVARALGSGVKLASEVRSLREGPVRKVLDQATTAFAFIPLADSTDQPESDDQSVENWRSKEPKKSHIVGLEDETETITNYLKEDSEIIEVISIFGMPGLGKTTLAWKILQEQDIQYEFPVKIWVTVSAILNRKDVFLTILKHFTKIERYSEMTDEEILPYVKEKLHQKKFLIILDDVWTPESWDLIKVGLPMQENGLGKVLITTRIKNVAVYATTRQEAHNLRFLNQKESWELLQYGIHDKLGVVDKALVNVGKVIAENCDGLPLSIVVIAGVLRDKIATAGEYNSLLIEKDWVKVSLSVKDYLIGNDKEGRMSKIIELSYRKLRYELRDCFLYMGMFPEDALISVTQLTMLWIAEGFIQPKDRCSLEEIALDNLNDLISRALVMVKKTKLNGAVKICSVHDAIREFCKKEAVENINLFQEIRMNKSEGDFEPSLTNIGEYRRISIHSYVHKFIAERPQIPARSFLCFPKDPINLKPEDVLSLNKAFDKLLRVFAAEMIKFPRFPLKIPELIHLRYLTLSLAFELKVLPDAIFNLWNLQALIVETTSRKLEIKADIWKIMQLRHLKTNAAITLTCKDTNSPGGKKLKTLTRLSPESCTDAVFDKARNLHTLGIRGDLSELLRSESLAKLEYLNKLKLQHYEHSRVACEKPLGRLPQPKQFPKSLRTLTLKGTYLKWDEMYTVGNLQNLEILKLKENAFMGIEWEVADNGFKKLEFLYIERTDLKFWTAKVHSFPKLKSLTLSACEALDEIPFVLRQSLEMLYLQCVSQSAVVSAVRIEKEKLSKDPKAKKGGFKLVIGAGDKISK